ncbi:hypothetical protein ACSBR2_040047 [Camellia fascicularis]
MRTSVWGDPTAQIKTDQSDVVLVSIAEAIAEGRSARKRKEEREREERREYRHPPVASVQWLSCRCRHPVVATIAEASERYPAHTRRLAHGVKRRRTEERNLDQQDYTRTIFRARTPLVVKYHMTWHINMEPNNVENDGGDCDWKPRVHMTFDIEQEAYNFYNAYEGRLGFSIRRGYVNKNKEGQITSRLFVCNKEGFRVVDKGDPLTKNHRQEISASQASEIDLAKKSGIRLNAAFELMGNEAGGRELLGFTKVDQKNYLRTKRQKSLASGEAGSILQYFREKTLENPSFFYSVQSDIEE